MKCGCRVGFRGTIVVVQPAVFQTREEFSYLVSDAQLFPSYIYFLQSAIERFFAHLGHAFSKHLQRNKRKKQSLNAFLRDIDRKSTRLNSSHIPLSRMPSSA